MDVMPGFRLTWHYNKEPGQTNYRTDHGSKFKRLNNLSLDLVLDSGFRLFILFF